jgi:hypothetical protein
VAWIAGKSIGAERKYNIGVIRKEEAFGGYCGSWQ